MKYDKAWKDQFIKLASLGHTNTRCRRLLGMTDKKHLSNLFAADPEFRERVEQARGTKSHNTDAELKAKVLAMSKDKSISAIRKELQITDNQIQRWRTEDVEFAIELYANNKRIYHTDSQKLVPEKFLELIGLGYSPQDVSQILGLHQYTYKNYCRKHPDFKDKLKRCEMQVNGIVEDALLQLCLNSNSRNQFYACKYWLEKRNKDRWVDKPEEKEQTVIDAESMMKALQEMLKGNSGESQ